MTTFPITFFFFFLVSNIASATDICVNSMCSINRPVIRFPFRLKDHHPDRCGYPGFDLTCNDRYEPILELPFSGKFRVKGIKYAAQEIRISDPDNCLPGRLLYLNLSGTPFKGLSYQDYTFFNCSSQLSAWSLIPIPCLSSNSFTVLATSSMELSRSMPTSCKLISTVSVPIPIHLAVFENGFSSNFSDGLRLKWDAPNCKDCEARGGKCRFKSNTGRETGCSVAPRRGLPRSASYAITIGLGIPALVCIIGLLCYVCSRVKGYGGDHHHSAESSTIYPQTNIIVMGLDGPTIESYPKVMLGESGRLPQPNDDTCSICLSEYRPKETLKHIPECKHCFHSDCIDQWLRMNATCPVCRNSPERSPSANAP